MNSSAQKPTLIERQNERKNDISDPEIVRKVETFLSGVAASYTAADKRK